MVKVDQPIIGHVGHRGAGSAKQSVGQVGQPNFGQVGQRGQVLQSKNYFRGRDLTSQLPREIVGILFIAEPRMGQALQFKYYFRGRDLISQLLFISISILYDQDHSYFRLRGSVRIFAEEPFSSGSRFRAHRGPTSGPKLMQRNSSAPSTLAAPLVVIRGI